jgi:hypothetical protein
MRTAVADGATSWIYAVLEAIRLWPLPEERVGDRDYRYLVAGEAFDWLLLAERLCEELDGLIPEDERDALLFHERLPVETPEEEFKRLLGVKYSAHLNHVYGVRVEAALQLAVMEEVRKEHRATRIWENGHGDDEAFRRIYGLTRAELLAEFWAATGRPPAAEMTLHELSEFRYWLFRRRVQEHEPARVASDTRKGVAMLQRMDHQRLRAAPARRGLLFAAALRTRSQVRPYAGQFQKWLTGPWP